MYYYIKKPLSNRPLSITIIIQNIMKPPVKPVEYNYFLEEALAELDKSILKSSEESVDRLLQQIYIDARIETIDISDIQELITTTDQLEIAMLTELLMFVQEKKEY